MTGSNRRPTRCKRVALPAELIAPLQKNMSPTLLIKAGDIIQRSTYLFTDSFKLFPGRNLGCLEAAI